MGAVALTIAIIALAVSVLSCWLVVTGFAQAKKVLRDVPKVRPCSCGHGYGFHDDAGCHSNKLVERTRREPVHEYMSTMRTVEWDDLIECGCVRYDGEIPVDILAR